MTSMTHAFYLCLAASIIWAPIVFLAALYLKRRTGAGTEAAIWPSAVVIASMPALSAPIAAAFGLSLRTPRPLPPMGSPSADGLGAASIAGAPAIANAPPIDPALVISAGADLYFYGFILFAALGAIRLAGFSYRVRSSEPIADDALRARLEDWRRIIGVGDSVRFAYSNAVASVCVHGFFRPVILMPPSLLERVSTQDAELMGAHELAHVRRGDTWLFALCEAMSALFWFNPFTRRIIARAQLAAEQAADAMVIGAGADRQSYARCFVESLKVSSRLAASRAVPAPSFTPFDKHSRRARLDAILSGGAAQARLGWKGRTALLACGALAMILAFGQAALAVAPPPAKEALTHAPVNGYVTLGFLAPSKKPSLDHPPHKGVDIAAKRGSVVRAAGDGEVMAATRRYKGTLDWGKVVVIDHGHGIVTRYAHLGGYDVRKGDQVKAGEAIGVIGTTGKSKHPHLHFEILVDGGHVDPSPILGRRVEAKAAMAAPAPFRVSAPQEPRRAEKRSLKTTKFAFGERMEDRLGHAFNETQDALRAHFLDQGTVASTDETPGQHLARIAGGEPAHYDLSKVTPKIRGLDDSINVMEVELGKLGLRLKDVRIVSAEAPALIFPYANEKLTTKQHRGREDARRDALRAARKTERAAMQETRKAQRDAAREISLAQFEARHELDAAMRQSIDAKIEQERRAAEIEIDRAMLKARIDALKDAEKALAEERAAIARLKAELAARRKKEQPKTH